MIFFLLSMLDIIIKYFFPLILVSLLLFLVLFWQARGPPKIAISTHARPQK